MATRNLTRLNVALTATLGPFASAMKGAENVVERFGSKIKSALLSPLNLVAGALTAGAFVHALKSASERIDALAKSADRLGVSTNSLAGFQHAAEQSGSSAEAMTTAMEKLTKKIEEAATGSKEAQKTFTDLGVKYSELAGLAPDQQFAKVADAIKNLDTQGQKTKTTLDLFGRSGGELANTLALGSAGLAEMTKEAEALGISLSRADAEKVVEAGDAMQNVGEVIKGIFNKLTVAVAPWITAVANAFTKAAADTGSFGISIENVVNFAVKAGGMIADAWWAVKIVLNALESSALFLGATFLSFGDTAIQIAQWIGQKFSQAWEVIASGNKVMVDGIVTAWNWMKIPFADFTQWIGSQIAQMLDAIAIGVRSFDIDLADSLTETVGRIRQSTGAASGEAQKQLDASVASIKDSSQELAVSTATLFSSVTTSGSAALQKLTQDFIAAGNAAKDNVGVLARQDAPSVHFEAVAMEIQAEATQRTDARAAQIAAEQEASDAAADIHARGVQQHQEQWLEYYNWETSTRAQNLQHGVASTSAFFANISKLQDSHSKTARKIGKAAAKAKIVTDTASAAMGAYSAMASIPYVGPVLGIAAAAAAVAAGAIQLANVDKSDSGSMGGSAAPDSSTTNLGGIAAPRDTGQTLVLQGDNFSAETIVKLFEESKERNIMISGVRRG